MRARFVADDGTGSGLHQREASYDHLMSVDVLNALLSLGEALAPLLRLGAL